MSVFVHVFDRFGIMVYGGQHHAKDFLLRNYSHRRFGQTFHRSRNFSILFNQLPSHSTFLLPTTSNKILPHFTFRMRNFKTIISTENLRLTNTIARSSIKPDSGDSVSSLSRSHTLINDSAFFYVLNNIYYIEQIIFIIDEIFNSDVSIESFDCA